MSSLPEGWAMSDLATVATFVRGVTYKKPQARQQPTPRFLPLLRATNVDGNRLLLDDHLVYVPEELVKDEQRLRAGDIVVATSSGSISVVGKSARLQRDWSGTFGAFCGAIRSGSAISPEYLSYFAQSDQVRRAWSSAAQGTNINNLKPRDIERTPVPVPPIEEQRRIVEEIDEQFSRLDAAAESLSRARRKLSHYRAAVLHYLFGRQSLGPVELVTGNRLFSFITSGSRDWARYYAPEGQPFIRIGNLQRDRITLDLTDVKHVRPPDGAEGERTRVQSGDLLVSITADIGMVGRVSDEGIPEMYVNQHIALARPAEGVDGRYVAWFVTSPEGQAQLQAMRRGATKAGLGLDDIRALSVPIPAKQDQAEVVGEVERYTSVIDALQVETESALAMAHTLRQAILSEAFAGRLVPQDPTDEPASVLLDRIGAASP